MADFDHYSPTFKSENTMPSLKYVLSFLGNHTVRVTEKLPHQQSSVDTGIINNEAAPQPLTRPENCFSFIRFK